MFLLLVIGLFFNSFLTTYSICTNENALLECIESESEVTERTILFNQPTHTNLRTSSDIVIPIKIEHFGESLEGAKLRLLITQHSILLQANIDDYFPDLDILAEINSNEETQ